MAGMGYYSGVLDALKANSAINYQNSETALNTNKLQELQQQQQEEDQAKSILQQAFSATQPSRNADTEINGDMDLSSQFNQAGKQLAGVSPKLSLEYFKTGSDLQYRANQNMIQNLEFKVKQLDLSGEIASRIHDQATLDENKDELAKYGVVIPPQYQEWNPQTADWFSRRAIQSQKVMEATKLQQDQVRLDQQNQDIQSKITAREQRAKSQERRDQLMQDRISAGRSVGLKFQNKDWVAGEIAGLNSRDDNFASLDPGTKMEFAGDVQSLAMSYLKDKTTDNQGTALELARSELLKRIDPETGKYSGFSAEAAQAKSAPKIGTIVQGYKFKGGPPGQPESWEKVQ